LYKELKNNGFLIYPGKLTFVPSFRIGSIGNLNENNFLQFSNYFKNIYKNMLEGNDSSTIKQSKILPIDFYNYLYEYHNIEFSCRVPDSLLQDLDTRYIYVL
jgi:hypothetical protein